MRKNLIDARKAKKFTQRQVSEMLGVLTTSYQNIEYGTRQGSIDIWDKLEDLFEIPQRELREITTKLDDNPAKKTTYQNDTTKKDKTQE